MRQKLKQRGKSCKKEKLREQRNLNLNRSKEKKTCTCKFMTKYIFRQRTNDVENKQKKSRFGDKILKFVAKINENENKLYIRKQKTKCIFRHNK